MEKRFDEICDTIDQKIKAASSNTVASNVGYLIVREISECCGHGDYRKANVIESKQIFKTQKEAEEFIEDEKIYYCSVIEVTLP